LLGLLWVLLGLLWVLLGLLRILLRLGVLLGLAGIGLRRRRIRLLRVLPGRRGVLLRRLAIRRWLIRRGLFFSPEGECRYLLLNNANII